MRKTRPRQVDLCNEFCAILYLLKNAAVCLAKRLSRISTVRYCFDLWSRRRAGEYNILAQALKKSGGERTRAQRAASLDVLLYRGRAKRQEYRHGTEERL